MRYHRSGVVCRAESRDALGVCQDEIRAVLRETWLPLSSGIEWIIENMETRGRETT